MEVIKRKITALKDELEIKEDEIVTLRAQLDKANIETEKAENEAASQNRRVRFSLLKKSDLFAALCKDLTRMDLKCQASVVLTSLF